MMDDAEFRQLCRTTLHRNADISTGAWSEILSLGEASYEYIMRCLEHGSEDERLVAAKSLSIFQNKGIFYRPEHAPILLNYLETESNAEIRIWYIHALTGLLHIKHVREIEASLLPFLFDEDVKIRIHISYTMSYLQSRAAIPYLAHLLDDEHPRVSETARELLSRMEYEEADFALMEWERGKRNA